MAQGKSKRVVKGGKKGSKKKVKLKMDQQLKARSRRMAGGYKRSVEAFCCVPGFSNSQGRCKRMGFKPYFYSFPKDKKLKKIWLDRIQCDVIDENGKVVPFQPKAHPRICSHFVGGKMIPPGELSLMTSGVFVDLKKKSKVFPEGPSPQPLSPISAMETDSTTQDFNYISPPPLSPMETDSTTPDFNYISPPPLSPTSPMETDSTTPDFNYISPPPLSPISAMETDLKTPDLPLDKTYTDGLVKQTEREGVVELAENLQNIKRVPTGAIIEEDFVPTGDQYTENVHYEVEKDLGKGSFGRTSVCLDSGKPFIRKKIKKAYFRSSEVAIPANLNHDNVTKRYGLIQRQEEDGDLTVELMIEPAGEALTTFTKNNSIDTPKIWDITKQMMAGLNHLHLYGIIHLNIKPENICVQMKGSSLMVKITDFGSAKKLPLEDITSVGMTPEYMAPEICKLFLQKSEMKFERVITEGDITEGDITEGDITGKADVFAAALVIMFLYEKVHVLQRFITGWKTSYTDTSNTQRMDLQMILMQMLATDQYFIRLLVIPHKWDVDMKDLLIQMTHCDHHRRFSAQEVMDFIDKRERRREEACKWRLAYICRELDNGPIRTLTKDKVRKKRRQKLTLYAGKGKGKFGKEETPMQEEASKHMEEVEEFLSLLATDQKFIWQSVIPDKCDVDMRELLIQMTHYDHHSRLSAQEVMDFIDKRERRREEECNRTQTKDKMRKKWRQKLKPYAGKSKWKFGKEETPMQEMRRMKAFHAEEFLSLVNDVSLSMGKLNLTERERRREEECNRTQTKDKMRKKWRQKLKPYAGKSKWKFGKEETPMQEMRRMQAFHAKEFLSLVNDVSLSMGKLNLKSPRVKAKEENDEVEKLAEELAKMDLKSPVQATSQPKKPLLRYQIGTTQPLPPRPQPTPKNPENMKMYRNSTETMIKSPRVKAKEENDEVENLAGNAVKMLNKPDRAPVQATSQSEKPLLSDQIETTQPLPPTPQPTPKATTSQAEGGNNVSDFAPPAPKSPTAMINLVLRLRNEQRELNDIKFEFMPGQDSADSVSRELVEAGLLNGKDMIVVAANLQKLLDDKHNLIKSLTFALNSGCAPNEASCDKSLVGFAQLSIND